MAAGDDVTGGDDGNRPAVGGSGAAEVTGSAAAGTEVSSAPIAGVLIIGIGSPLRRDDAVGHAVIDALADLDLADTELQSVHQLTPEVAAGFPGRRLVVFVDAAVDTDAVTTTQLSTDASGRLLTHHMGAAGLLGMAGDLGWSPKAAALVSIPATDLGLGTGLSDAARGQVEVAVDAVLGLIY